MKKPQDMDRLKVNTTNTPNTGEVWRWRGKKADADGMPLRVRVGEIDGDKTARDSAGETFTVFYIHYTDDAGATYWEPLAYFIRKYRRA